MKNTGLILLSIFAFSCQPGQEQQAPVEAEIITSPAWQQFGGEITEENPLEVAQLPELLERQDSAFVKVKAEALSSCPMKGCWMKVKMGEGEEMRVTFKDYAFFVPKDIKSEEVVFEGVLRKSVSDVASLRHYAQDEGASKEEINSITEPKEVYSFEATAVLLKR